MKIEIQIDERCDEPKIVVMTHRVTEEISEILKKLSEDPSEMLAGFRNERASIAGNERLRKKQPASVRPDRGKRSLLPNVRRRKAITKSCGKPSLHG